MNSAFIDTEFFRWVVLPILIFLARMADVSLGTLRNVFISRGFRSIVPFVGFFEVLIWLVSMRQIMQHLDNPLCYIGFAGGFAMGTYVGLFIERQLALGMQVLRIITPVNWQELADGLRSDSFGVTVIDGHGAKGPVKILFCVVKRKDLDRVRVRIREINPEAFYSIEDIRVANQGVFPKNSASSSTLDHIRNVFPDPKDK
ncbi:MAG: DUF2179 domain-containing protein [Bacteroidota bacterium]|jgi:uncharacterized protein YebE (UPF0316 family)|uniref:DUF2179 domain-containing protein n=1 Tax=Candidatus Pollutiaquabacter sp. TaxID=3416354 RepID=UPI001A47397B|nr:DUF2179 domain-containing protein [Bacteroidota bacterium]MBL7948169.1 DUF2179 domain-containing protein [Bacteroidia bacterium]MBP6009258.1 DUF2179 domain-containing protein [Bacteroidia bacterium]MBP7270358.1 DUF2179 domain-containing protein [Bacteroidia bacterium]MBP7771175.1 DUF2179 domain-containing protein [Bacteroidia bacterium]